jgi:hypothetical protein
MPTPRPNRTKRNVKNRSKVRRATATRKHRLGVKRQRRAKKTTR